MLGPEGNKGHLKSNALTVKLDIVCSTSQVGIDIRIPEKYKVRSRDKEIINKIPTIEN